MLQSSVLAMPILPVKHLEPNWPKLLTQQRMRLLTVSMKTELLIKSGLDSTTLKRKAHLSGRMAHLPFTPTGRAITVNSTMTKRTALEKQ